MKMSACQVITGDKIAVVVPALHEARNLELLLPRLGAALAACGIPGEILVVDDDSRDGTEAVVRKAAAGNPCIRYLLRKDERGLAGAILHGWQHTDATILGVMDADWQHPPELIPQLLAEVLKGNDLVLGSRYAGSGGAGFRNPIRRLLSWAAICATRPLLRDGLRVRDPMSGYFLVRRRCVEGMAFQQGGFKLLLEILVRGHIRSVCEVPFAFGRRSNGSSKASLKVAVEYLQLLARLYAFRWSEKRAMEMAAGD